MDLSDETTRAGLTARLAEPYAGRPMLLGPGVLAGYTRTVRWFRDLGCPVLVVSTADGAGPLPDREDCEVVEIVPPPAATMTDEVRRQDAMARHLPPGALEAIERFDPERRGAWWASPFVTTDEPVEGRPVVFGRPAVWVALEDKMLADGIWDAAGVPHAPSRIVANDPGELAAATAELAGPLGAVWVGDARDGLNGGGNYVRWVVDQRDQDVAARFFRPRCDRIRVMPFLEGVPCSIHGFVLPDGTAVFRPVEIVTLRNRAERRFVYAGLGTYWDPPDGVREDMRAAAARVGAVLAGRHGYRGAFGVDGVLTADGFLPTELNPRLTAGATQVTQVDTRFFDLLQAACVTEPARVAEVGVTVDALESLVPAMDAERTARVIAFGEAIERGRSVAERAGLAERAESEATDASAGDRRLTYPLAWDGERFTRTDDTDGGETGNTLSIADAPAGFFAKLDPCNALRHGHRQAPVNRALLAFLDTEYDAGFGELEVGADVRAARASDGR